MMTIQRNKGAKIRKVLMLGVALLMLSETALAQDYPFNFPNNFKATLDVNTSKTEAFKNQLLGYNIEGFKTKEEKDFMRKFDPVSVRFPHGVWANFYKWQTDGYQNDSYDNQDHENVLDVYVPKIKGHIDEIASLNQERKLENGYGYHMMWTYAMNFDDAASCVARAKKDLSRGLEVKDIELGNEHFWKNQRSNQTKTPEDFRKRCVSVANALHKEFPDVRVSIPLGWRRNQGGYNAEIAGDQKYYDAITLHRYMGADPDKPGESDKAYSSLLSARLTLNDDVVWLRNNYGKKPIWLTEWGVSAGGGEKSNSAACLGMADVFLFMSENQEAYERANWFSFNRALNPMVLVEKREPVYPLKKRGYLMAYELVYDVMYDGIMYETNMNTEKITNSLGSMNAVNARVVTKKDGSTNVIVVNLSDKAVEFVLKFDGSVYTKSYKHEALKFNVLGDVDNTGIDANVLDLIKNGSGKITLPPLSISKISNIDLSVAPNNDPVVSVTSPANNAVFELGATIPLTATATDANGTIDKVNFKVNEGFLKSLFNAPYEHTFTPTEAGTYKIAARAFDNDNNQVETFITITVVSQESFKGTPIAIPGTIEAEDFDKGGQGISYNDTDTENVIGEYRPNEGVDIGTITPSGYSVGYTSGDEWLEYTVDVAEAKNYDITIHYSSGRAGGGLKAEVVGDNVLFGNTSLPQTAGWDDYKFVTEKSVYVKEGKQVLRFTVLSNGFNLDKVVFKPSLVTSTSSNFNSDELAVFPNPSSNGVFNISESLNWEVFSTKGVFVSQGESNLVDLSDQPQGVYFLRMNEVIKKVVIQ